MITPILRGDSLLKSLSYTPWIPELTSDRVKADPLDSEPTYTSTVSQIMFEVRKLF